MSHSEKYLIKLIVILIAIYVVLVSTQYIFYRNSMLPATPVSSSLSFNEKLGWISQRKSTECDVILAGSSIALNNTESNVYINNLSEDFINISSWGLTINDTTEWLDMFMGTCRPGKIILLLGANDFRKTTSSDQKNFDKEKIGLILDNELSPYIYTDVQNTYYLLKNIVEVDTERKSRAMKNSLYFDAGGSVPLEYKDWSITSHWNQGYVPPGKINTDNYRALSKLIESIRAYGADAIIVLSPIRPDMQEKTINGFDELKNNIKNIASIHGAEYLDLMHSDNFENSDYVDITHMNSHGAKRLSGIIVNHIKRNN